MAAESHPILTFILAVKDPDEAEFEACTVSMAALRHASRLELIIVSSGHLPPLNAIVQKKLHDVRIVEQEPSGVYPAYNRGLDEVRTAYVMVIGSDDLVLPGLDGVIEAIPANDWPHLIAASALMQNLGISRPSRRRWGLIFRNWCQQGLLYRSDVFAEKRFDPKYKIQADHKFNMELVSDHSTQILYRPEVVAHFSSRGISQTESDWVFRKDMPRIVLQCYGPGFWLVALLKRTLAGIIKGYKID
jgi:glycosyltransferase involved in cell wall biosynthesis